MGDQDALKRVKAQLRLAQRTSWRDISFCFHCYFEAAIQPHLDRMSIDDAVEAEVYFMALTFYDPIPNRRRPDFCVVEDRARTTGKS